MKYQTFHRFILILLPEVSGAATGVVGGAGAGAGAGVECLPRDFRLLLWSPSSLLLAASSS